MTQTVMVPLASDALYVSGTVNGVDKVWTREEGDWWSTTAEKSIDNTYHVVLSIIYNDGKTTSDSITLYYGLTLITDRTQSDIANRTKKGYYNAEDLNRVGAAVAYIRDRLNNSGYNVSVTPDTSWTDSDIPLPADMEHYLDCISTIRAVLRLPADTPIVPETMEKLTYIKANDIEKILEIVDKMLTNSMSAVWYSGDIYSGEVI